MLHDTPPSPPRSALSDFDLRYVAGVAFKYYKPIAGVVLLSLLFGFVYLSFQKPHYKATALVQLNTNTQPLIDTDAQTSVSHADQSARIQSELDVIKSPALIERVVRRLELDQKPEFNAALRPKTLISTVKTGIKGLFRKGDAAAPAAAMQERTDILVTQAVIQQLSIQKDPLSYTVKISFLSERPERAKVIANTIADEYLAYQIEMSNEANRQAHTWYLRRIDELRANVMASEQALQTFREENNLFELDGKTLDDQQVSELNTLLGQARAEEAQARVRYERASQLLQSESGADSVSEVLNSVLIQRLREKEAELLREKSELSGHFGPKHPQMEQIHQEIADLRIKIKSEIQKILAGMENEVVIARARVTSLEQQMDAMREVMGDDTRIELTELKREADANRVLYESFLSRAKESREAENIDQATARIISPAALPLSPAYPRKSLILAFFLLAGLFGGAVLAFALELFSLGFTEPEEIEEQLGLPNLGTVPEMDRPGNGSDYFIPHPLSIEAQSLRKILAMLKFSDAKKPVRSLMIASSLPQEGKGWLSLSLACTAAQSGKRVLLVDGDFHRAILSDNFSGPQKSALNLYLGGQCGLEDIIHVHDDTGLHYIRCVPERGNIQKLIESDRMKELMQAAHKVYDLIVVDAPPIIGLPDDMYLARLVDTTLMAVQWNKTPRRIVANALRLLSRSQVPVSGVVLTRVHMKHYKRLEFGDDYAYNQYVQHYGAPKPFSRDPATGGDSISPDDKIIRIQARS